MSISNHRVTKHLPISESAEIVHQIKGSENGPLTSKELRRLQERFPVCLSDFERSPMVKAFQKLSNATGYSPEITAFPVLAALSAAVGNSRLVNSPEGYDTTGLFHTLLVGSEGLRNGLLLRWPFASLREQIGKDVGVHDRDPEGLSEKARHAVTRRRAMNDQLALATEAVNGLGGSPESKGKALREALAASARGMTFSPDSPQAILMDYHRCEEAIKESDRDLVDLVRQLNPLAVAESLSPEQIINSGEFGVGGCVCNLDSDGKTIQELLHSAVRTRRTVLDTFNHSFDNTPRVKRTSVSAAPAVAHIGIVDEASLSDLIRDRPATESCFLSRCVVLDLPERGEDSLQLAKANDRLGEFDDLLLELYNFRTTNPPVRYTLSDGAAEILDDFATAVDRLQKGASNLAGYLRNWHLLAPKVALLIHLGSHRSKEKVISPEAMAMAAGLLSRSAVRGLLRVISIRDSRGHSDDQFETQIQVMVQKIRMKGTVTKRELARSYNRMKVSTLEFLLKSAIESGEVIYNNGRFMVKEGTF